MQATKHKEANVDEDGSKNGARDGLSISGIIHASDELLVAGAIQSGEDGEDDDGEEGDDGARPCLHSTDDGLHDGRRGAVVRARPDARPERRGRV